MLLISPFTDYYDYLAHQYRDPKLVYRRDQITAKSPALNPVTYGLEVCLNSSFEWLPLYDLDICAFNHYLGRQLKMVSCLVVCSRIFLVVSPLSSVARPEYTLLSESPDPDLVSEFREYMKNRFLSPSFDDLVNHEIKDDRIIALSRVLKQPVYLISGLSRKSVLVNYYVPVLRDSGISKLYSATDLYQDIAYFVGNILLESPDLSPPVEVQDKYKIEQHGFNKQSFRKPKETRR